MILPSFSGHFTAGNGRIWPAVRLASIPIVGLLLFPVWISSARAQVDERSVPTQIYHANFGNFYEGRYKDALAEFRAEGRGAIKTGQLRWIDSICYHTMCGECYYHMGQLPQALEHYTSALKMFSAYSDWMIRVKFPPSIRPAGAGAYKQIPWGKSTRRARLGHFPNSMLIGRGRIDNNEQYKHGGIVDHARFLPIQVGEIVRCTTLAMRRRLELMGPVCRHDPLTAQLITALSRRPGPPNHWSEAWIDVQLGLALLAGGREAQAIGHFERSVVAAGEFDHPLTSTALLTLGQLALGRGDYAAASKCFLVASYAAVYFFDGGVLEEALRYGTLSHLLANRKGVYPPLVPAARWAKVKGLRQLQVSLLVSAAENYAVLRQTRQAAGLLGDAKLAIGRREMGAGRIGAQCSFLNSLVLFQQGKIDLGDQALATAMGYMRHGSYWLFRISLADNLYVAGAIRPRVAMDLYANVLRDPKPADWAASPIESLAVLVSPHPVPLEHWFEVALERKNFEKAMEISDRMRRHRFFSSLGFGGRLTSLRWILEGPIAALDKEAQLQRQDLLVRYPGYEKLSRQARQIRDHLRAEPLVIEDPEAATKKKKPLASLAEVSLLREAVLREMAVRRDPAKLVFPPLRSVKEVQGSLPGGRALLVFFATSRHLYGFLLNKERYTYWQVGAPAVLNKRIVGLLREMGQFEQNRELAVKELADTHWKQSSRDMLDLILKGSKADFTKNFKELIIVPDGVLWYLPFESLEVDIDGQLQPLISRFRIRYAPTISLAVPDGRGRKPTGNTAVVVGHLFPRDDDAVAQAAFEQLSRAVAGAVALKNPMPGPSAVYGSLFDRLIVLDDILPSESGPYGWAPVPIERGKPGNTLNDWLSLPWDGPETIILPGFHTAAENSLKRVNPAVAGAEMFLSVCGLMSNGAKTLLLSRWRTGGETSFELVREFAQELPHTSPADAWQRAVLLTMDSRLNLEAEPRVKRTTAQDPPKATHPFFWAGYMLIDSGDAPQEPEPEPDEPVLKFKKPAQPAPKKQ